MYRIMSGVLPFGGSKVYYLMNGDDHVSFGDDVCFHDMKDLLDAIKNREQNSTDWNWSVRLKNASDVYNFEHVESLDYEFFNRRSSDKYNKIG